MTSPVMRHLVKRADETNRCDRSEIRGYWLEFINTVSSLQNSTAKQAHINNLKSFWFIVQLFKPVFSTNGHCAVLKGFRSREDLDRTCTDTVEQANTTQIGTHNPDWDPQLSCCEATVLKKKRRKEQEKKSHHIVSNFTTIKRIILNWSKSDSQYNPSDRVHNFQTESEMYVPTPTRDPGCRRRRLWRMWWDVLWIKLNFIQLIDTKPWESVCQARLLWHLVKDIQGQLPQWNTWTSLFLRRWLFCSSFLMALKSWTWTCASWIFAAPN